MGSSGLELCSQDFQNSLSLCAMIGLSSSWPMASLSSSSLFSLHLWPSFPLPFGLLLFSCGHGFLRVAGEGVPPMLQAPFHTSAPVACWEVVRSSPRIPMCIFREEFDAAWPIFPLPEQSQCLVRGLWITDSPIRARKKDHELSRTKRHHFLKKEDKNIWGNDETMIFTLHWWLFLWLNKHLLSLCQVLTSVSDTVLSSRGSKTNNEIINQVKWHKLQWEGMG